MPLQIIHQDITTIECDAIVNPTDSYFSGGGGTDHAVHTAAGEALDEACAARPLISCAEIAVTPGFQLPCRYILHTKGPRWHNGNRNESMMLRCCYLNALFKARELELTSVAFPLISSGTFGFPKDKVLRIAIDAISDFLLNLDSELNVFICIKDRNVYTLSRGIALREFLGLPVDNAEDKSDGALCADYPEMRFFLAEGEADDEECEDIYDSGTGFSIPDSTDWGPRFSLLESSADSDGDEESDSATELSDIMMSVIAEEREAAALGSTVCAPTATPEIRPEKPASKADSALPKAKVAEKSTGEQKSLFGFHRSEEAPVPQTLTQWLKKQDDTFAVTLLKLIDAKGMDEVACYKKANVSKNTFSKIKNSATYRPSKPTVLAFAIALELTLEETEALLRSAGFALSHNNTFDKIIEFYILRGEYDIFEINAALYQYDQVCLGC